jgi:hypothetical protein
MSQCPVSFISITVTVVAAAVNRPNVTWFRIVCRIRFASGGFQPQSQALGFRRGSFTSLLSKKTPTQDNSRPPGNFNVRRLRRRAANPLSLPSKFTGGDGDTALDEEEITRQHGFADYTLAPKR